MNLRTEKAELWMRERMTEQLKNRKARAFYTNCTTTKYAMSCQCKRVVSLQSTRGRTFDHAAVRVGQTTTQHLYARL